MKSEDRVYRNWAWFLGCLVVGALVSPLQAGADGAIPYTLKNATGGQLSGKKADNIRKVAMAIVRQRMANDGREVLRVDQTITETKPVTHYLREREKGYKWIAYGRESIVDALTHWKSPHFIEPEVRFTVPLSPDEADTKDRAPLNKDNVISFNVVRFAGHHFSTSIKLRYRTGTKALRMSFDIHNAGSYLMKFSPGPGEDGEAVILRRAPIVWSLGESDKFALRETPAHEVLHCQLSPYTIAHALKHDALNEVAPSGLTAEQKKVMASYIQAEETVVDGMAGAWLSGYLKKIGIDTEPTYLSAESRLLADKLADVTPQEIVEHYVKKGPLDVVATYAN